MDTLGEILKVLVLYENIITFSYFIIHSFPVKKAMLALTASLPQTMSIRFGYEITETTLNISVIKILENRKFGLNNELLIQYPDDTFLPMGLVAGEFLLTSCLQSSVISKGLEQ